MTCHRTITCDQSTTDDSETLCHTTPTTSHQPPRDYHRCAYNGRLLVGGDSEQNVIEDAHETMTDSAPTACNHRLSHSRGDREIPNDSSRIEALGLIDSDASCSQPLQDMCSTAGTEDAFHDRGEKLSAQAEHLHQFHDMLCNISTVIVENSSENLSGHDVLRFHCRTPHTIVLDSLYPELAPHIVITPPPETWDAFHVADGNRVGYQSMVHLTVPPFFLSTCRMHTYDEWLATFYPIQPLQQDSIQSTVPIRASGAPRVFNSHLFQIRVEHTEHERLSFFTRDLVAVLHKRLFKLTAINASLKAREFSMRYKTPVFLDSVEKPYKWTDPADPILSGILKHSVGLHVIHSVDPFLAPHIIIHEAPSNDPWTLWENATGQQDCSFGSSLVVGLSKDCTLTYVNIPYHDEEGCHEEMDTDNGLSDFSSDLDSPGPETPQELQILGNGFSSELAEEDITDGFYQNDFLKIEEARSECLPSSTCEQSSNMKFFILDEDEDDGPPAFDDWFISIVERTSKAFT